MSDNFDNLLKSDQGFPDPSGGGLMSSRTDLSQAAQTGSSLQTDSMDFVLKYIRHPTSFGQEFGVVSRMTIAEP